MNNKEWVSFLFSVAAFAGGTYQLYVGRVDLAIYYTAAAIWVRMK